MKNLKLFFLLIITILLSAPLSAQNSKIPARPQTPIMGWSSWNNYRVNINEDLIKAQADAMITSGMKAAGYTYLNIDDGFFGGRDENGRILPHPKRFPHGMKSLAKYIHKKGLTPGIYSDAGALTCASIWDQDSIGVGMGLYHHEWSDLQQMLVDWDFDFIKVDWCGGEKLGLDEEAQYTLISRYIRQLKPSAVYNVCRWEFPGEWVINIADSWRISGDIRATFASVMHIVDLNADLWKYAGPGHVNDMDMLQVGRGMTYDEDKAHFSMWCMLASPLLAGNDLTDMSKETLEILTNKELIAINQDPLVYQARRLKDLGDREVWARPLQTTMSGQIAVALLNRSTKPQTISFNLDSIGLLPEKGYRIRDLWAHKNLGKTTATTQSFTVPAHGVIVLKLQGEAKAFNVFQTE